MAWRDQDQAFTVVDGGGVQVSTPAGSTPMGGTFDVAYGSTSSMVLRGGADTAGLGSPFGGSGALRTFVVPSPSLLAVDVVNGGIHPDYLSITPPTPGNVCYFQTDGAETAFGGGARHEIHPRRVLAPPDPSYPLIPTGVRLDLRASGGTEAMTIADFSSRTVSLASTAVQFESVTIQDPHVCQIPMETGGTLAGKWVMVATRARVISGVSTTAPATSRSVSDVVLYVAEDSGFQTVLGPYLVVDGLNALGPFSEPASPTFRVWCSVPSAVVDGAYLLVAFMAEACDTGAAFTEAGRSTSGFSPGPAVVRVLLHTLERAYADGPTAESGWEATYDTDGRCGAALAPAGDGLVRLWVTDPDLAVGWYQPFASRFPNMKAADPAIVIAGGVLTLYYSVLDQGFGWAKDPGTTNGQGLWRASDFSAASSTTRHVFGRPTGIRGRDFVVRSTSSTAPFTRADAPDLVRTSNVDDGILADPDPFETGEGSWVVFHGRSDVTGSAPGPTGAVVGARSDAVVGVSDGGTSLGAPASSPGQPLVWPP